MRSYDTWLQDSAAYEAYSDKCAPQNEDAVDADDTDGAVPARQAKTHYEEDTMQTVSRQEAREYRIELALQEIEEAADIGRFRPEVASRCLGEIWHKVKQLRRDMGGDQWKSQ